MTAKKKKVILKVALSEEEYELFKQKLIRIKCQSLTEMVRMLVGIPIDPSKTKIPAAEWHKKRREEKLHGPMLESHGTMSS